MKIRKVRFKNLYEEVFFHKNTFFAKIFELRIVWPWMLMRSKALIKADLLDIYNMFIRPTKIFLFASEVQWFQQIRTFSRIFNLKIGFLKSTRIKKWAVAYVCRNKNRFTHRMITPFVSACSYLLTWNKTPGLITPPPRLREFLRFWKNHFRGKYTEKIKRNKTPPLIKGIFHFLKGGFYFTFEGMDLKKCFRKNFEL